MEVVSVFKKLLFLKDDRVDLPMCRCKDVVTFQPPEISLFVHGETFHQLESMSFREFASVAGYL